MGQVNDAGSGPQDRKPGCDAPKVTMVPGSASLEVANGPEVGAPGEGDGGAPQDTRPANAAFK